MKFRAVGVNFEDFSKGQGIDGTFGGFSKLFSEVSNLGFESDDGLDEGIYTKI